MPQEQDRKTNAILKIIAGSNDPVGSVEISAKLKEQGIDLSERTVRYHLKKMNEDGLIRILWKEGRMITQKGKEELNNSLVSYKVGLVSSHIESMSYQMDFDLYKMSGKVVLNLSLIPKHEFKRALKIMEPVFKQKFATGDKVAVAEEGEELGGIVVPAGKTGFGSLCSINLNGILLKHSIPVESKFGGLLQMDNGRPLRFTDIINYAGSTLDPHEVFIRSKMTSVTASAQGSGKILAGLREIPDVSRDEAEAIIRKAENVGIGRALLVGKAGQSMLGMPVGMERAGVVVPGGLNPIAAVEEAGIQTESKALVAMIEYERLVDFWSLIK